MEPSMSEFTLLQDLTTMVSEVPEDSILSRTVYDGDDVRAVLFRFAAGQELSEHTASMPAVLHFISGEATLTLGGEPASAQAGTWVRMPAKMAHSIHATTPLTMLLLLLKNS
jgi:quercetin dioxygenase-like cupin family protein